MKREFDGRGILIKLKLEDMMERDLVGNLDVNEMIILKHVLKYRLSGSGTNSSDSGWGPVAGSYEHDNEPSGSIKAGNFLIR
jgi:hypothetical protein